MMIKMVDHLEVVVAHLVMDLDKTTLEGSFSNVNKCQMPYCKAAETSNF